MTCWITKTSFNEQWQLFQDFTLSTGCTQWSTSIRLWDITSPRHSIAGTLNRIVHQAVCILSHVCLHVYRKKHDGELQKCQRTIWGQSEHVTFAQRSRFSFFLFCTSLPILTWYLSLYIVWNSYKQYFLNCACQDQYLCVSKRKALLCFKIEFKKHSAATPKYFFQLFFSCVEKNEESKAGGMF